MLLRIRNMQSSRCEMLVKNELQKLGFRPEKIELGKVEINGNMPDRDLKMFETVLENSGLEIMHSKEEILIGRIKEAVHQLVYLSDDVNKPNFSDFIRKKVNYNYTHLSNVFSEEMGITIEKYVITQKIERVKDFLVYMELSLNDIAFKMQYSSVSHLSNQFKKVTGMVPSDYLQLQKKMVTKNTSD